LADDDGDTVYRRCAISLLDRQRRDGTADAGTGEELVHRLHGGDDRLAVVHGAPRDGLFSGPGGKRNRCEHDDQGDKITGHGCGSQATESEAEKK
jgi:hypothetical protein